MALLETLLLLQSLVLMPEDLATCVVEIIYRHFTSGRPILVSQPIDGQNINGILHLLHNSSTWPFQVSSPGAETLYSEFEDYAKHHSYLIFIWISDEDDDIMEMLGTQFEDIEVSSCWNPRANFLIVIYGPLSEEREEVAQSIAEELWSTYKIININILLPEFEYEAEQFDDNYDSTEVDQDAYDEENEYTKDKIISTKINSFELYSWAPYISQDICAVVHIYLSDRWLVTDQKFEKGVDLYAPKMSNNFYGCKLSVSPIETPPVYVMATNYTDEDGNIHYEYFGYETELMKFIVQFLNFTIDYRYIPPGDPYDTRVRILGDLNMGLTDLAFGCFPLHPIVITYADPCESYIADDVRWLVPCGKPIPRMQKVGDIFSPSLWCALGLVIIISAGVMWQITKYSKGETSAYKTISICLLNLWAIMLGAGVTDMPRTHTQRTVFLFLVWYAFAINLLFQTYFTSILVDPGISDQISSREQLYESNLEYHYQYGFDIYIARAYPEYHNEIPLTRKECSYKDTCIVDYYGDKDIATIGSQLYTECFLLVALPADSDIPQLCLIEEIVAQFRYSMYVGIGSPLVHPLNMVLRRIIESGVKNKIEKDARDFLRYHKLSDINIELDDSHFSKDEVIEYFVFAMSHMKMVFYMLGLGCALGGVLLLGEILYFKTKTKI
ncbi:Ionotropic receptor 255 [Blattella germanica]|nr:Ionotropic receptor 255 [Blattella germanica]